MANFKRSDRQLQNNSLRILGELVGGSILHLLGAFALPFLLLFLVLWLCRPLGLVGLLAAVACGGYFATRFLENALEKLVVFVLYSILICPALIYFSLIVMGNLHNDWL